MVDLEIKITCFTCMLNNKECVSFPTHLALILMPNISNEGVEKQWNTRYHVKFLRIVPCLTIFRLNTLSIMCWRLVTKKGEFTSLGNCLTI